MTGQAAFSQRAGVPAVGEVIAQKYRVESIVGAGGMGVVVSARHLQLGQVVAIKLLTMPDEEERQGEAVARFLHEAQAVARLQNDHVVRIYDVGQLESGLPFMVMELLNGIDLATMLEDSGPMPEARAVEFVLQACAGVAEAHRMGIVHRDLKPSNLFVTQRSDGLPLVKVLDFGISKRLSDPTSGEPAHSFTSTRTLMGSPNYMSPEQIRDARRVDGRTDVWALGIILQELLTGAPVFRGESFPGVCAAIVADPPMPVRVTRPDVSAALEAVITCCLQKDPKNRFQSIPELVRALSPLIGRGASAANESVQVPYYSSHPRIVVTTPQIGSEHLPRHDSPTVSLPSGAPSSGGGTGGTLESARLATGVAAQHLPDSRVQVLSSARPLAKQSQLGLYLGLLGVCSVLAAAAWLVLRPSATTPVPAPSAAAASPPASGAPVAAPTGPSTLSLDSEPSGATVREGSVVLGVTPLKIALPESAGPRAFLVEKPGYQPYVVSQAPTQGDVQVVATLSARPGEASAAPASSAAPAPPAAPPAVRAKARPAPPKPAVEKPKSPSDIRLER